MPWQEASTVELRQEFVLLALKPGANRRALARRYGVSPTTAYKWLARYQAEQAAGLADRSRRPHRSPRRSLPEVEAQVLAWRDEYPAWGGRKLAALWQAQGRQPRLHASTVTAILRRHGRLSQARAGQPRAWQRFEAEQPNALWQMDFKGHFALGSAAAGSRCHPLGVLDDHSRFCVLLAACADERGATVQQHLIAAFQRYGLPDRLLMDNGGPWGGGAEHPWTPLTVWLLRLGIRVSHGRPAHPQSQGKQERFHRSLVAELLQPVGRPYPDLACAQHAFDRWRDLYNLRRPHEACALQPPGTRYQPSPRGFPDPLPPLEYGPGDLVRRVQDQGLIWLRGRAYRVGQAFRGLPVALRPTASEGVLDVYCGRQRIQQVDLRRPART
jgi:transposase InsO family protein